MGGSGLATLGTTVSLLEQLHCLSLCRMGSGKEDPKASQLALQITSTCQPVYWLVG